MNEDFIEEVVNLAISAHLMSGKCPYGILNDLRSILKLDDELIERCIKELDCRKVNYTY